MDLKVLSLSIDDKKTIETKLVNTIIQALENHQLSQDDLPEVGDFILKNIDVITNQEELNSFLNNISSKWPIFLNLSFLEKEKIIKEKENKTIKDILKLTKAGQIDQAVKLAKTATNI